MIGITKNIYINESKKTGRGRKQFEYENEMDVIFGKNKNINPELLLSTTTIQNENTEVSLEGEKTPSCSNIKTPMNSTTTKTSEINATPKLKRRKTNAQTKHYALELLRQDKKNYYEKLVQMKQRVHEEKSVFQKSVFEEKIVVKQRMVVKKETKF